MPRPIRLLAALILLAGAAPARSAAMLPDSTVAESWRLDNGLEVRTRSVPGVRGVSVTLAFRAGSGYEPANQEGLASLLAELEFFGPAGGVPERTQTEMASLRPLGWESDLGARLVHFTEVAAPVQLPGVLQQFATRLAGINITAATLKEALTQVRREAGARWFGDPGEALHWRAEALARGLSDEQIVRQAGMPGLARLSPSDVAARLRAWYQPGNASLALAGDLSGIDVHALVSAAFGKLPGGPGLPDTVQVRLRGSKRKMAWKGLAEPVGIVATSTPSLTDSLHPGFYIGMLVTGAGIKKAWGAPSPPITARFHYSLLDEPELLCFYPPVRKDAVDPDLLSGALYEQLQAVGGQLVAAPILDRARRTVRWLLGAELPGDVLDRFRAEPGAMGTLSSGMAARALWMGDAFWRDYLAHLDRSALGHSYFYPWLADPEHQTVLLLTPEP